MFSHLFRWTLGFSIRIDILVRFIVIVHVDIVLVFRVAVLIVADVFFQLGVRIIITIVTVRFAARNHHTRLA